MGETTQYHYLVISCAPESGEGIGCAGGAGFARTDAKARFDNIPGCREEDFDAGQPTVVLDYLDEEKNIVDTKFILPDTASALLGVPVQDVYQRAWDDLARANRDAQALLSGGGQ